MKTCSNCGSLKALSSFTPDVRRKDGTTSRCKECTKGYHQKYYQDVLKKKRTTNREDGRRYRAANREKRIWYERGHKYGLTKEQYNLMLKEQEGCCAICTESFTETPHIDHCHSKGTVRGLLCPPCNRGIGHLKDNIDNLYRAIEYLSPSSQSQTDATHVDQR